MRKRGQDYRKKKKKDAVSYCYSASLPPPPRCSLIDNEEEAGRSPACLRWVIVHWRPSALELASPCIQTAPLMVERSSGTTLPFQSLPTRIGHTQHRIASTNQHPESMVNTQCVCMCVSHGMVCAVA